MILQANKLRKAYGNKWNKQEVLKGIDLLIDRADFVSIMGASGSGKTTLLNVLSTIDHVSSGSIIINEMELTSLKEKQLAEFRKKRTWLYFSRVQSARLPYRERKHCAAVNDPESKQERGSCPL